MRPGDKKNENKKNRDKKSSIPHVREDNIVYPNFGALGALSDRGAGRRGSKGTGRGAGRGTPEDRTRQNGENNLHSLAVEHEGRELQVSIRSFLSDLLEDITDSGRLARGRTYEEEGHVLTLQISEGTISADVAGTQSIPFDVTIVLPSRSEEEKEKIYQAIQEGQLYRDSILSLILADEEDDIRFLCDCPDEWSSCCKHGVATLYRFMREVDKNPDLLVRLRGWRGMSALDEDKDFMPMKDLNSAEYAQFFWEGASLPDLPEVSPRPALEDSDLTILHQAMRKISKDSVEELRAVADIEDLYYALVHDK